VLANYFLGLLDYQALVLMGVAVFVMAAGCAATVVLARRAYLAVRRTPARLSHRWLRWTERAIIAVAALGLVCAAYGWLIEPYWLDVTETTVTTPKLPAGAEPIRIVHISDLHCDPKKRLEDEVVEAVRRLRPDVICFTGDALNSSGGIENFRACMTSVAQIAPTYAVHGNWESHERLRYLDLYGGTGVRVLNDRPTRLRVRGQPLNVVGIRHQSRLQAGLVKAMTGVDTSVPTILLCHVPSVALNLPGTGIDLALSGHTHGGQIALPFYGALVTLTSTGKRFERGLYNHQDTHLYVSRGIGMEGGPAPRVRFFARPEVTLIELSPAP